MGAACLRVCACNNSLFLNTSIDDIMLDLHTIYMPITTHLNFWYNSNALCHDRALGKLARDLLYFVVVNNIIACGQHSLK